MLDGLLYRVRLSQMAVFLKQKPKPIVASKAKIGAKRSTYLRFRLAYVLRLGMVPFWRGRLRPTAFQSVAFDETVAEEARDKGNRKAFVVEQCLPTRSWYGPSEHTWAHPFRHVSCGRSKLRETLGAPHVRF